MNEPLFRERLSQLIPFSQDTADVQHLLQHERCLWALFVLDIETLESSLDYWMVDNSDPMWMLRKAALLTEIGRNDESSSLIQKALNMIRAQQSNNGRIASCSREGWALMSTLTMDSRQAVFRRWDELAPLKCDAWMEIDRLERTIVGTEQRRRPLPFDLGRTQGTSFSISNERHNRVIASYRAVRMAEVAGMSPTNIARSDLPIPTAASSRILRLAAEELHAHSPKLATSLVLRICASDIDDTLRRVLSRRRVADLSEETAATLVGMCTNLIENLLSRMTSANDRRYGFQWVQRMQVVLEVLSRLVVRVAPEQSAEVLQIALTCYRTPTIAQHPLLGAPLGSLFRRSWESLSNELREQYALTMLALPVAGVNGFSADAELRDPALLVTNDDILPRRTPINDQELRELIDFLIQALHNENSREQSVLRLLRLTTNKCLTHEETSRVADAIWKNNDPILSGTNGPNAPFDWVYFTLPQSRDAQAEASFRRKWLSPDANGQAAQTRASCQMLVQVGAAMRGLRSDHHTLSLSAAETEQLLASIIGITEMLTSDSITVDSTLVEAIRYIPYISEHMTIPTQTAEYMYKKMEVLLSTTNKGGDDWLMHFSDINFGLAYSLIPGLLKSMPDFADDLESCLRMGFASDDDTRMRCAMGTLRHLIAESPWFSNGLLAELLQEIGTIIASRRRPALADALSCATLAFDGGQQAYGERFSPKVLEGLGYLADELRYDLQDENDEETPTLRLLCVQLAMAMADTGFEDDPAVGRWLEIGRTDPFPEIRSLVSRPKLA